MRASEVFTPNKEPSVTYVDAHLVDKAKHLLQSLETSAAVISLSGPSKSGKTVFIEKTIGRDRLIEVNGAGIDSTATLWNRVFSIIGTPTGVSQTNSASFTGSVGAKASAGVPLVAQGEASATGAWASGDSKTAEQAFDPLHLLIKELGGTDYIVFIDDFHYIPKDVQVAVANEIKEAIHGKVRFVCASVPYHSGDMLLANADLRGRTFKLDFDYWKQPELLEIARRGFSALNLDVHDAVVEALAMEAAGSPQLMQTLCLTLCFETGSDERVEQSKTIAADLELISRVCRRASATNDYSSTVEKMKDGPKTRGKDRKSHALKATGSVVDVYPLILMAIASNPPQLTIRYANLVDRIGRLCAGEAPSGSSIISACSHMTEIANDAENRQVVEWDTPADVLDIRDPYLLFYLRWAGWH